MLLSERAEPPAQKEADQAEPETGAAEPDVESKANQSYADIKKEVIKGE